jgi:HSP20 family protein
MTYPVRQWRTSGVARDPFGTLESMQHGLSRLFDNALPGYLSPGAVWHPDVDVDETDDGWVVEVRLPGVAPDGVSVEVNHRELTIRSRFESEEEPEVQGGQTKARVRKYGSFLYRLALPSEVDIERIDATMDQGLLTIKVPRAAQSGARSIDVGGRSKSIEGQTAQPVVTTSQATGASVEPGADAHDSPAERTRRETQAEADRPETEAEADRPETEAEADRPETEAEADRPETQTEADRRKTRQRRTGGKARPKQASQK